MSLEKRLAELRRRINRLKHVTRVVYRPRIILRSLYETISILDMLRYSGLIHYSDSISMIDTFQTIFKHKHLEITNLNEVISYYYPLMVRQFYAQKICVWMDGYDDYIRIPFSQPLNALTVEMWICADPNQHVKSTDYESEDYPGNTGETVYDVDALNDYARRGVVGTHSAGYLTSINIGNTWNGPFVLTHYAKVDDNTQSVLAWRVEVYEDGNLKWSYEANANYYTAPNTYRWKESPIWIFEEGKSYELKIYWAANVTVYSDRLAILARRGGVFRSGGFNCMFRFSTYDEMAIGFYTRKSDGSWHYGWTGTVVPKGEWHHIVWVHDGNNNKYVYMDGNLVKSWTNTGDLSMNYASDYLYIGYGWRNWCGFIDEVRVYNRALQQPEILQNYNNGFGTYEPVNKTGLIGWWHLDEGTGTSVTDASGTNPLGTLYNGVIWSGNGIPSPLNLEDRLEYWMAYVKTRKELITVGENILCVWAYVKSLHDDWLIDDILKYRAWMIQTLTDTGKLYDQVDWVIQTILTFDEMISVNDMWNMLFQKQLFESLCGLDFMIKQDTRVIPEVNVTRFDYSRFNECGFDWSHMIINDKLQMQVAKVSLKTLLSQIRISDKFSYQFTCGSGCEVSCQTACEEACQTACEGECQTTCEQTCQISCLIVCLFCEEGGMII